MDKNEKIHTNKSNSSRMWSGLILLGAGLLLLAYKMGFPIPGWIFTWPVLLIVIGIISGIKSNFRNPGSFIMIMIGAIFLADYNLPGIDFHDYIFPAILIGVGMLFIFRPKSRTCSRHQRREGDSFSDQFNQKSDFSNTNDSSAANDNPEYVDINAIFGGVKKKIFSKNFQGGEIVSFMGGTEINLAQADMQHPVTLEVNNVFGGTKIVIPSNWDIKNEISAIFGGVEDKRAFSNTPPHPNKVIMLKGSCIFGGIEISNY